MKRICAALVAVILIFSMGVCALAEGGDGSGGGSGTPLTLDYSSVPSGSTDVPTDVTITLTFTKNVVNFAVKDNNMGCFSLVDSAGNGVPISVIMGDDQVDSSIKRIISISPATLSPGETYTLTISGNLQAKNGTYLGSPIYLTFTTAGAAEEVPPPAEDPVEDEPSEPETPDEPEPEQPSEPEPGNDTPTEPEKTEPEEKPDEKPEETPETPDEPKQEETKPAEEAKPAAEPEPEEAQEPESPAETAESETPALVSAPAAAAENGARSGGVSPAVYVAGGVVVLGAAAYLIFRKKK